MKAAIIAVLALSAISVAVAVTVNAYSDAACNTLGSNPILGLANPSVVPLNTCSKSYIVSSQQLYIKFTACTSTAATSQTYTDSACSTCIGGACVPSVDVPDKCTVSDLSGVGSFKVSCSSAATATITFVSVVAAALAVSL